MGGFKLRIMCCELEDFGPGLRIAEEVGLKIMGRTVKSAADAGVYIPSLKTLGSV